MTPEIVPRPPEYAIPDSLTYREHLETVALALYRALEGELYPDCTCDPAYKNRGLQDPTCGYCDQEELRAALVRVREAGYTPAERE